MEDPDFLDWTKEARVIQNQLCNLFGSKDYDEVDQSVLSKKVGMALFGYPDNAHDSQSTEYSEDKQNVIDAVVKKIESASKKPSDPEENVRKIHLAVIFGVLRHRSSKMDCIEVAFKVKGYVDDEIDTPRDNFIDKHANVYNSFDDLLSSKVFSNFRYCWPRDGTYNRDVHGISKIIFEQNDDHHVWYSRAETFKNMCKLWNKSPKKVVENVLYSERSQLLDKVERLKNLFCFCVPQVPVINRLVDIFIKFKENESADRDLLNFSLFCSFLFNVDITTEMARKMITELAQYHQYTIGILSTVDPTPKLHFETTISKDSDSEAYYNLLNLFIGIPTANVNSFILDKLLLKFANINKSYIKGELQSEDFIKSVSESLRDIWKLYESVAKEGLDICCNWRFTFNPKILSSHSVELNGQVVPTIINFEIIHEISIIVRKTVKAMLGFIYPNYDKIIMRLYNDFDKLDPSKSLLECLSKLSFFCQRLLNKHKLSIENYEHEFDLEYDIKPTDDSIQYNIKNGVEGLLGVHYFNKTREFTMSDFKNLNIEYKRHRSYPVNNYRTCQYNKIFPFCYPPNIVFNQNKDFFSYARKFTEVEINETNCQILKENNIAIVEPLPHSKVPKVFFYIVEDFTHPVGIAVVNKD